MIISFPIVPTVKMAAYFGSCTTQFHYISKVVSDLIRCNYNDFNILYHGVFMRKAILNVSVIQFLLTIKHI